MEGDWGDMKETHGDMKEIYSHYGGTDNPLSQSDQEENAAQITRKV